jgi:hypothetical protein
LSQKDHLDIKPYKHKIYFASFLVRLFFLKNRQIYDIHSKRFQKGFPMAEEYKKFASKMRDDLYRKLKLLSAAEGKSIQTLIEEAIMHYLDSRGFTEGAEGENVSRYSISFDIPKDTKEES